MRQYQCASLSCVSWDLEKPGERIYERPDWYDVFFCRNLPDTLNNTLAIRDGVLGPTRRSS